MLNEKYVFKHMSHSFAYLKSNTNSLFLLKEIQVCQGQISGPIYKESKGGEGKKKSEREKKGEGERERSNRAASNQSSAISSFYRLR